MSSWKIIKDRLTRGTTPGTIASLRCVYQAALVYSAIAENLTDKEIAHDDFMTDTDVTDALSKVALIESFNGVKSAIIEKLRGK